MSSPATKSTRLARLSLTAMTLLVGGCQDYAARRDTIAFHAGEAAAYNRAVHTIDPWPAASARTDLSHNGERAVRAIERYEAGSAEAVPSSITSAAVPMAAAPPR